MSQKKPQTTFDIHLHFLIEDMPIFSVYQRVILCHVHRRGFCWEGVRKLAEAKNMSVGSARNARKWLLDNGMINRITDGERVGLCLNREYFGLNNSPLPNGVRYYTDDKGGYIYIIKQSGSNLYKIGKTANRPERRLKQLQTGNPNHLTLRRYFLVDNMTNAERGIHAEFAENRIGGSEWFELDNDDIEGVNLWIDGYLMSQEVEL